MAVAPWLADAHIQVIQVSRELGLATEVEYGPGYPFGPRPVAIAVGAGTVRRARSVRDDRPSHGDPAVS